MTAPAEPTRPGRGQLRRPDSAALAEAAAILRAGGLVAFPTETVYGLGADATDDRAVAGIFAAKERPRFNPVIVHFHDPAAAERAVVFEGQARALAERFWPGPLSLVLPRDPGCRISLLCSAGLDSLAVRVPGHGVARALLEVAARPLAAPSANRAGALSPTTAAHVAAALGDRVPLILDGGPCPVGIESTVLDLTGEGPILLRPGGLSAEAIEAVIGPLARAQAAGGTQDLAGSGAPKSPGLQGSHYAPRLPLRLEARSARPHEALLAFGPDPPRGAAATANLSPRGDLVEAAAQLFAALHRLDRPELRAIAVMPIPETGLGLAINDRLRRAAAPRDGEGA
ncbi:MAG: L-threonylcarbamoyladenylate synthase [Kiloniellales bacterium]